MLSDRCLEELYAGSREGILLLDAEGTVAWGNPVIGEFFGIPTADLLGRNFHSVLLKEKRIFAQQDEVLRLLQQVREKPAPAQIPCTIVADSSRHERSLHLVLHPAGIDKLVGHLLLRLTGNVPLSPVMSAPAENHQDIRSLERQFLTLFEGMSDGIMHLAGDHTILLANRAAVADAGQECIGKLCFTVFRGREAPCENCPVEKSRQSGREEVVQIVTLNERVLEARAFPIPGEDGKSDSFLVHMRDQTENLRLKEIAFQTMPLASLGELAAGVAHEINNPATGIINCAQLLFDRLDGRDRELAQRIMREGERISAIVRNLLSLARVGHEKNPGVKIEEELADLLSLTRAQMRKERIILIQRLAPDLPPATANSQQIRQVFLNLINNARYALNQKYPGFSEDKVLEIRGEKCLGGVRFIFHDYGTGIPKPILGKIFRPFFTTKPVNRGTGLGLSISRSIISDHGGTLAIDSVEGEYTRAIIDLPIA